jgi:hypothetical protein
MIKKIQLHTQQNKQTCHVGHSVEGMTIWLLITDFLVVVQTVNRDLCFQNFIQILKNQTSFLYLDT